MICKECNQEFKSLGGLHTHISKTHGMLLGAYYVTHFPRFNKLTGNPIPYKNYNQYLEEDFSDKKQLVKWCYRMPIGEVKQYLLDLLRKRILKKDLKSLPTANELATINMMPSIFVFEDFFLHYQKVSDILGLSIRLELEAKLPHYHRGDMEILIDTREQQPLEFSNSRILKLEFGDYTAAKDYYSKTFVERKSMQDFIGTMSQGFERFCNEMERAANLNAYLYVVVDGTVEGTKKFHKFNAHQAKTSFIFSRMREIQQKYANCQFVFSGGRDNSEKLIPKLLFYGPDAWGVDVQYFVDKQRLKLENIL